MARSGADWTARGRAPAHLRAPARRLPLRAGGERSVARGYIKALDRARAADLHRGPVPLVLRGRRRSRGPWRVTRTSRWSRSCRIIRTRTAPLGAAECLGREPRSPGCGTWHPTGSPSTASRTPGDTGYVHAKVCVIDDLWATTGSDNFNRRSWTHDSELSAAVWTRLGAVWSEYARDLRLSLARSISATRASRYARVHVHHLPGLGSRRPESVVRRRPPSPRPPGRLRPLDDQRISSRSRWWAEPLYRTFYDPDARPLLARVRGGTTGPRSLVLLPERAAPRANLVTDQARGVPAAVAASTSVRLKSRTCAAGLTTSAGTHHRPEPAVSS